MRYFLIIFSIIITFSCTPNDTSSSNSTKTGTKTAGISSYTHPFGIYKMNIPDLWKKEFNDKTETIILTNPPIDGRTFDEKITIVTRRGALFFDKDKQKMISKQVQLAPLVKEYLKSLKNTKGFKLVEVSDENVINKNKKAKVVFELEDDKGLKLKTQTELVNNGETALFVHYTASQATFDKTFSTYQSILKSIQFLDK